MPLGLQPRFTAHGGDVAPRPSKTSASDTFAALTRQQWDDYLTNFVPIEDMMIQYATDPQVVTDAVMNARSDVDQSFDAQAGISERRNRGLGITLNADEQRAADPAVQSALANNEALAYREPDGDRDYEHAVLVAELARRIRLSRRRRAELWR